ncbi:MAG: thiamine pyrophosphate-dependent enzyme [Nitrospinota bacterium]|nr:thiamine pyrophosphate-dependent enzyme [Nitrospinota bacterium]
MSALLRREVVSELVDGRNEDLLVLSGLGCSSWDLTAAGDSDQNFYFIGAMGMTVPTSLGLALAREENRVLVITGDGDMLMNLGILATVGMQKPTNLAIVVLDNGMYGETGGQETATSGGTNLEMVAKGAGITNSTTVATKEELTKAKQEIINGTGPVFVNIKVAKEKLPLVLPPIDGITVTQRFRKSLIGKV